MFYRRTGSLKLVGRTETEHDLFKAVEARLEDLAFGLELFDLGVFFSAEFLDGVDDEGFVAGLVQVEVAVFSGVDPLGDDLLNFLSDKPELDSWGIGEVVFILVLEVDGAEGCDCVEGSGHWGNVLFKSLIGEDGP